jgi:hypothetical protein
VQPISAPTALSTAPHLLPFLTMIYSGFRTMFDQIDRLGDPFAEGSIASGARVVQTLYLQNLNALVNSTNWSQKHQGFRSLTVFAAFLLGMRDGVGPTSQTKSEWVRVAAQQRYSYMQDRR